MTKEEREIAIKKEIRQIKIMICVEVVLLAICIYGVVTETALVFSIIGIYFYPFMIGRAIKRHAFIVKIDKQNQELQ